MSTLISQLNQTYHSSFAPSAIITAIITGSILITILLMALAAINNGNIIVGFVLIFIGCIGGIVTLKVPNLYNHHYCQQQQQVMQKISKKKPIMTVINGKYVTFDIPENNKIKKNQSVNVEYTLITDDSFNIFKKLSATPKQKQEYQIQLTKKHTPMQVKVKSIKQYQTKDYLQ